MGDTPPTIFSENGHNPARLFAGETGFVDQPKGGGGAPYPPYIFCVNGGYPLPLIERGGGVRSSNEKKLSEVSPPQGPSRGTAGASQKGNNAVKATQSFIFVKLNAKNMPFDLSTLAPTLFIASISAAGLVFTAGNVVIGSLNSVIREMETTNCPTVWPNIRELYKLSIDSLKKSQRDLSWQITCSVVVFLACNICILAYWLIDIPELLKIAVTLYIIGLAIMVFIVTIVPDVWKLMVILPLKKTEGLPDFNSR